MNQPCVRCGQPVKQPGRVQFCGHSCHMLDRNERMARPEAERFWAKVDTSAGPDGCWPWQGTKVGGGYGRFRRRSGVRIIASRMAHLLTHGHIPDGHDVLHTCDNPPCCNPIHLFSGTARDNALDMVAKGRAGGWAAAYGPRSVAR